MISLPTPIAIAILISVAVVSAVVTYSITVNTLPNPTCVEKMASPAPEIGVQQSEKRLKRGKPLNTNDGTRF